MYICVISTPHFRLVHSLAFCYMCADSLRATFQALAPLERNLSRGLSHWSRAQTRFQRGGIRLVACGYKIMKNPNEGNIYMVSKCIWVLIYIYIYIIYIYICLCVYLSTYVYIYIYILYMYIWLTILATYHHVPEHQRFVKNKSEVLEPRIPQHLSALQNCCSHSTTCRAWHVWLRS